MGVKTKFEEILIKHGREIYLATQTSSRCPCYNQLAKEADISCPYCLGTGNISKLHKVISYSRGAAFYPSQANANQDYDTGEHSVANRVYYLNTDPKVDAGDMIIEPVRKNGRLYGIESVYRISTPYLYTMEDEGEFGRAIYVRAGAVVLPSYKKPIERALKKRFREGYSV